MSPFIRTEDINLTFLDLKQVADLFCYWAVQLVTFWTQKIKNIIFCLYVNLDNLLFSQILNFDPLISLLCEKSIICYSGLFFICFSTRLDLSTDVSQLILLPWSWEKLTFKKRHFFTFSRSWNTSFFCCHGDIICISIFLLYYWKGIFNCI